MKFWTILKIRKYINDYADHVINSTDNFIVELDSLLINIASKPIAKRVFLCWISMLGKLERGAEKSGDAIFTDITKRLYITATKKTAKYLK